MEQSNNMMWFDDVCCRIFKNMAQDVNHAIFNTYSDLCSKQMKVKLSEDRYECEEQRLLSDDVFMLFRDYIIEQHNAGTATLLPAEAYLTAKQLAGLLLSFENAVEGIDDELDDLESELECKEDAVIVGVLLTAILSAVGRENKDCKQLIMHICTKWNEHPLFEHLMIKAYKKENEWRNNGKRVNKHSCVIPGIVRDKSMNKK